MPCNLGVRASDASRQAAQCAGQYQVVQPQHHPIPIISTSLSPYPNQSSTSTYHSQILKRPRLLNIPQRLVQILQLLIDYTLRLLSALDSLRLKRLDRLQLPGHIVRSRLEGLELLLDGVDDGAVLELVAVLGEVDGGGLFRELGELAAGVVVALFEGEEGGGCVAAEAELGGQLGPVELEGCASLLGE